jgi:hypothetical protein
MRMLLSYAFIAVSTFFSTTASYAQSRAEALKAFDDQLPGRLVNDPTTLDWVVNGRNQTRKTIRNEAIPGGGVAVQIDVKQGGQPHEVSINIPLSAAISKGEKIVMAFYARALESQALTKEGIVKVRFQQGSAPWGGFGDKSFNVGPEWKLYEAPGVATVDLAKGNGNAVLQLAGAKQKLEIGQIIVSAGVTSLLPTSPAASSAMSALPPQLASKGKPLLLGGPSDWRSYGFAGPAQPVKDKVPGGTGTRYVVATAGKNPWDAGLSVPIKSALSEGQPMLVAFIARTISSKAEDGKGRISIKVQQSQAPYAGFGDNIVAIGPNWGLYQIRMHSKMTLAEGRAQIAMHFAQQEQTIEVGPVYLLQPDEGVPAQ